MKRARRPQLGREFWRLHVEQFASSGLSQSKYAKEHGLISQTLSAWIARFRKESGGRADLGKRRIASQKEPPAARFAKVVVSPFPVPAPMLPTQGQPLRSSGIRLIFPGDIALELNGEFDAPSVAKLIAAMGGGK